MKIHTQTNFGCRKLLVYRDCQFGRNLAIDSGGHTMRIILTVLLFVLLGFAIVGLLHGSLFIVLTRYAAVKHDAQVSLVISVCTGFVVSLLYD